MGAGASVQIDETTSNILKEETMKPLDASDVATPRGESAKAEVIRLRALIAENAKKTGAPAAQQSKQPLIEIQGDTTKTCLARVEEALKLINAQGEINACAEILNDKAIQQAKDADARIANGEARRPLEGVPIIVKINIDIAGTLSTGSMPGFADWRPSTTAPVVTKLLEAGAIVVAKTNMPEAAFGPFSFSPLHGLTLNPKNTKYTTAGSSSGTAAGIAAGMVQIGLGSDTGGSLRMPAECCGIVGLCPSRGRYPRTGVVPCNSSHDTPGPMASSVANLAVMDAVIIGEAKPEEYKAMDLKGKCIGIDSSMYAAAVPGHKKAIDLAKKAFEELGATTKEVEFYKAVKGFKHEKAIDYRLSGLEDYIASHPDINRTADEVVEKSFWPQIKAFFHLLGPFGKYLDSNLIKKNDIPENEIEAAETKFKAELKEYEGKHTKFLSDNGLDFVITPVIHGPPPKQHDVEEFKDFSKIASDFGIVLGPSSGIAALNELSIPSLAMPTKALHEENIEGAPLPAGILLWGKPFEDKNLIEAGMALEVALS